MTRSLLPRIGPVVGFLGAQGWIALGLIAGVVLAYRYSRPNRRSRWDKRGAGRWEGEREHSVDENVAMAS
jgi:hypothetical protein